MTYWIISSSILWIVVLLTLLYIVALTRQIGILHQRIAPVGARMTNAGLDIGEYAPIEILTTISGSPIYLRSSEHQGTVLLFISTTCPACSSLASSLRSLFPLSRQNIVLIFSEADRSVISAFLDLHRLQSVSIIASPDIGASFRITGVPYGIALDSTGIVRGKGIANTSEHVESLLNALSAPVLNEDNSVLRDTPTASIASFDEHVDRRNIVVERSSDDD